MFRHPYSRPLNNLDLIESFLKTVLNYNTCKASLLNRINSGEADLKNCDSSSATLHYTKYRSRCFVTSESRWKLRNRIVAELFSQKRLNDDDKIKIGSGGSLPAAQVQNDSQAYIIIGLPASGKSGIAKDIADMCGAVILDSDFAKRKLPEFKATPAGASLVHDESDLIIFGTYDRDDKPAAFESLFDLCLKAAANIVIPKIGYDSNKLLSFSKSLKENYNYDVHLILVSLDRRQATIRALNRFQRTKRYVPLSLIFDGYGNDPILTYYRLKTSRAKSRIFRSLGKLSTDVPKGSRPVLIDHKGSSPALIYA